MKNKIFIFVFLFAILGIGIVSATFLCNDFTSKWNYCNMMNISGASCDNFWQNASDCNVASSSINQSNYYTKAQVDSMLANFTIRTDGNISSIILYGDYNSSFVSKEDFDAFKDLTFANFITNANYTSDMYQLKQSFYQGQAKQSNDFNPLWILVFVAVVCGAFYLINSATKKKKNVEQVSSLPESEAISNLRLQLEKIENKSKNIKSKQ